jgi:redox-sensing transcriptional repressor
VKTHQIRLAILAVPAGVAQEVAGQICRAGVQGILNFAPVTLNVPAAVAVVPVDLAVQLEQLSYLTNTRAPRRRPGNRAKRRPQP